MCDNNRQGAELDDWVKKLKAGGNEQGAALSELSDLLGRRIEHAFRGDSKVDGAFVEDIVQESLTAILDSLHQFEGKSQFLTWATTIGVRTAIREMRRLRWKDTSFNQMMKVAPGAVETASLKGNPEDKANSAQMVETMYQIINQELTDKQREVLLAHLGGMPQAEIGRRMGVSRNAVYKLGFDARKRLKESLIKTGFSGADLNSFEATR